MSEYFTRCGKVFGRGGQMVGRIQKQLWDVAVDQYGYVTSKDAHRLGINVVELGKLAARNQIKKVGHGIYRFSQLPANPLDAFMLATLWANGRGVLSHDTALDLHGLCDINPSKIHITVGGRHVPERQGGDLYVVHLEDFDNSQITRYEGIPIVRIATAIDQCIRSGVSLDLLTQALTTARERGAVTRSEHDELTASLEARR